MVNPLLETWNTPFETPPFDLIRTEHFKPAIIEAINSAKVEIDNIAENPALPDFENTVASLDLSGQHLGQISLILFNLNSAETSPELMAAAQDISPVLTRFSNDITLNKKLFERIRTVYNSRETLNLNTEQKMLLEKKYRSFILGGAALRGEDRIRFRDISEELSKLALKFEENVLEETNAYEMHLTNEEDLDGLPGNVIEMASIEARKREKSGWIFTLDYPSYISFMQYSDKRELREKMLKAFSSRAFQNNNRDNRELVSRIVNLRLDLSRLLGFSSYAEMAMGDRMAEKPEKVNSFLDELFSASHGAALNDFKNVVEYASQLGYQGSIERWDWAYYSEKLKRYRYNIDDEILRPYFPLEKVQNAIFFLATRLFGLYFLQNSTIQVYNAEVTTWDVHSEDGSIIAVLYLDFHPRKGKNGGAWMTSFREQRFENEKRIVPLISIVTNFSRPTDSQPSLLTFNELTTFLHEFGHALHGMLSQCTYEGIAGTNVARDFVELPSQLMENWAFEQEWLDSFAAHYETGEKIPPELLCKIKESSTFNEGYACNRQLGFAFLDMAWHTLKEPFGGDIVEFEESAIKKTELFRPSKDLNISCAFTHLFGGGYAAGYYGYKWAEVLDADAFKFFRDSGLFNKEVAIAFKKYILETGGSDKPMNLYLRFRGKEPTMDAFLERNGLSVPSSGNGKSI